MALKPPRLLEIAAKSALELPVVVSTVHVPHKPTAAEHPDPEIQVPVLKRLEPRPGQILLVLKRQIADHHVIPLSEPVERGLQCSVQCTAPIGRLVQRI